MCCNWTVKFFELNADHSWQAAHLLLQNQKPYLFCFFHSTMCILLNNHGYSLVCKYINVCLINDYVIVLFFEQIKMLYIQWIYLIFSSSKIRTLLWHYKVSTKCIQYYMYSGFLFFFLNDQVHKDIWSLNLMVMIMMMMMWWWWWSRS